jgi:outer membrane protein assembly factor BamA
MAAVCLGGSASTTRAQTSAVNNDRGDDWVVIVDGQQDGFKRLTSMTPDSARASALRIVEQFHRSGFLYARFDSAQAPGAELEPGVLFITRGTPVLVGRLQISGIETLDPDLVRRSIKTRVGQPLDERVLEADMDRILSWYDEAGLPLARAEVDEISLVDGVPPSLSVAVSVHEGRRLTLTAIHLDGASRTRPGFAERVTGLRAGREMTSYDPDGVRSKLASTGFFQDVGEPSLELDGQGGARLVVPVSEESPGSFDLVIGFLPTNETSGEGGFVGNGHLELRNLFGGGREVALKLDRLPGRRSTVSAHFADPYILGLPVGLEADFDGVQQDSTYDQQEYGLGIGFRITAAFDALLTVNRAVTKPGQAGLKLVSSKQRIPRSEALFLGIRLTYRQVDRRTNPRNGIEVESAFEQGTNNKTFRAVAAEGDTLTEKIGLRQERLRLRTRFYIPTFRRQVFALGIEAQMVISDSYDESDLIRFGGASTLRGYNEQRFLGRLVGRAVVEYRYQLDRDSYAFLFSDFGFVEVPSTPDAESQRGFYPGFGVGMQFRTGVGLVTASYAFNDEEGVTDGRVHFGLSFGL